MGYSPILGRFLQRDPIGYDGDLNLFEYVQSNPLRFTDPFGLQAATTQPATQPAAPTVIAKFGGKGGSVAKIPWGGGTLRLDTSGGTLDYQFFPGVPKAGVQSCWVPCANQTWLHEIRIILPKNFSKTDNYWWNVIAGGEGGDHGMTQVVYEEGTVDGVTGFVGDNFKGDLNLPYTGSSDPTAVPMSPNLRDAVGVPKEKYGKGNYTVVKQFIDIPLCDGKPLGPVIVTNLVFNPSKPNSVTVVGSVLDGPPK